MQRKFLAWSIGLICLLWVALAGATTSEKLKSLSVPAGFQIAIFSDRVPGARSLALGEDGTVFVGTRDDRVYAVRDTNGDKTGDKVELVATELNMPNGVAVYRGDLYVAEVNRILKWEGLGKKMVKPGAVKIVTSRFPSDLAHGWKFIAFGPDGKLYVPVGAPCNICEPDKPYASITRMNPDGSQFEIVAWGVRNSVGFDWHPKTKEMWFTDNGRDLLGDTKPPCEINHLTAKGQHFGYPYCHGGDISDPEFGEKRACSEFRPPARRLEAHVAPLGVRFYTSKMFPTKYRGQMFLAEHGSWNRSRKIGYRVMVVSLDKKGKKVTSYEPFITGWLDEDKQEAWGRPVDIQPLADGSILVSDDKAGVIYRVTYSGKSLLDRRER